jgi:Protein of unknown function (DUF2950)
MMRVHESSIGRCGRLVLSIGVLLLLSAGAARAEEASGQKTFAKPEEAMRALVAAAKKDDSAAIRAILGPNAEQVLSSGDPVADAADRKWFVNAASRRTAFEKVNDNTMIAQVGAAAWPLAIPLVKSGDTWRFDTAAGADELLNRRIGRNELTAISVARAYVDAQREYAAKDRTGSGAGVYAQKVTSEPGKHDGLYWEETSPADRSPLGSLVADASTEGYSPRQGGESPRPYHGYFYRILTAQGAAAPGGAKSYITDGQMTGGFALVAYPAEYRSSGIMTFIVGPQGIVFQKDLGEKTEELGKTMTEYNPDDTWTPARDTPPAPTPRAGPS